MRQAPLGLPVLFALGCISLAGLLAFARAESAFGGNQLYRSHPSHFVRGAGGIPSATPPGNRMRQPRSRTPVIMRSDRPLAEEWAFEKKLSEACNRGRLRQKGQHYYVAKLAGRTYGVAIGGHSSLQDPERLAVPDTYYVVLGQGTSNCRVYGYRGG